MIIGHPSVCLPYHLLYDNKQCQEEDEEAAVEVEEHRCQEEEAAAEVEVEEHRCQEEEAAVAVEVEEPLLQLVEEEMADEARWIRNKAGDKSSWRRWPKRQMTKTPTFALVKCKPAKTNATLLLIRARSEKRSCSASKWW